MIFRDVIIKKRDGGVLDASDIQMFVDGLKGGEAALATEQASALAMAILLRGMTPFETAALTKAMARSGEVIDWRSEALSGPVLDKHSTGGVGDKVSLMLAPMLAACGAFVPMISGRGLGHTGGTLDKFDAIPGYCTEPDLPRFKRVVKEIGCAIIGQTGELAPADKRLYAIRDVTGTVESIPLITASILSKKVAAGLQGLVMDVKTGSGAFMQKMKDADRLAKSLVETAAQMGLPVHALITDMNQALGFAAGNALEVREAIDYLTNAKREARLNKVVIALSAEMLIVGKLESDRALAKKRVEAVIKNGKAAEHFAAMVTALGGPADLIEKPDKYLASAKVTKPALPKRRGFLAKVDCRAIGMAVVGLGGGRVRLEDKLDFSVGLTAFAPIGAEVGPDRPLAVVHAANEAQAAAAIAAIQAACEIADTAPPLDKVVYKLHAAPQE
jgi:thymidine phosphorylase